ncbi:MAG TPA: bifunctional precorrin-2 dehydrogenase/sirohydrochlorin ferrochelatase [Bryobacteraceae bacterium]|jgi:siroheme synthase-like protein
MNFRYPIFLDLSGKTCLVVGEGHEIAGKVRVLVDAGATVRYVNPRAEASIKALATAGLISWERREFEERDLDGCFLAIADCKDNAGIFRLAEERRVLINAVDDPEHCRFSFGSVHRQGDLTIAISTNGAAPALAVRLRERLQREIGPEYGELVRMLQDARSEIGSRIADFSVRRALWYRIVDSDILDKLCAEHREEAERALRKMIEEALKQEST